MINGCIGRLGLGLLLGLLALACGSKSGPADSEADAPAQPAAPPGTKKAEDNNVNSGPGKAPTKKTEDPVGTSGSDTGGGGGNDNSNNNNNNTTNNNNNNNGDQQQQQNNDNNNGENGNNGDSRSASGDNCCYNGTYLRCPNSAACFGGFDVNACTEACGGEFDCSMSCLTKMGEAPPPTSSCKKATPPPNVQCGG